MLARPGFALSFQQGKTLVVHVYHLAGVLFVAAFGLLLQLILNLLFNLCQALHIPLQATETCVTDIVNGAATFAASGQDSYRSADRRCDTPSQQVNPDMPLWCLK